MTTKSAPAVPERTPKLPVRRKSWLRKRRFFVRLVLIADPESKFIIREVSDGRTATVYAGAFTSFAIRACPSLAAAPAVGPRLELAVILILARTRASRGSHRSLAYWLSFRVALMEDAMFAALGKHSMIGGQEARTDLLRSDLPSLMRAALACATRFATSRRRIIFCRRGSIARSLSP
jgi:hypothetical protein